MTPDASKAIATGAHLRSLVHATGLSQAKCAERIGVDPRTMRRYLAGDVRIPYAVEFAVECLARE